MAIPTPRLSLPLHPINVFLLFLPLIHLTHPIHAQSPPTSPSSPFFQPSSSSSSSSFPEGPSRLADILFPEFFPVPNAAALSLASPTVLRYQTPVAVLFILGQGVVGREAYAACHPTRLSFFGTVDPISPHICSDPDLFQTTVMLGLYHVTRLAFPGEETGLQRFLQSVGVDVNVQSSDRDTPNGWALWVAQRYVTEYLEKSGWNANGLGDSRSFPYTGGFPRRFTDTTQYRPVNPGHLPPENLRYPLRWQPLTQMVDSVGDWATQVHITPHIGTVVRPLSFTTSEWLHLKTVRPPYKQPNAYRRVSKKDRATLQGKLIPHMLRRMQNVYEGGKEEVRNKQFRIQWWDNKFVSLGVVGVAYEKFAKIPRDNVLVTGLGEMMALHDATILAFREKLSHDLARPETIMRYLYTTKTGHTHRISDPRNSTGNASIPVDEFETFIRTMPHSEFPSASAVLCSAVATYVERQVTWRTNGTFMDTGYDVYFPKNTFPFFPEGLRGDVRVGFASIGELAKDCGASRVAAGLHFQPSVDEGSRIGRVVGEKTFETFRDLEEGRVPKSCHWCLRG